MQVLLVTARQEVKPAAENNPLAKAALSLHRWQESRKEKLFVRRPQSHRTPAPGQQHTHTDIRHWRASAHPPTRRRRRRRSLTQQILGGVLVVVGVVGEVVDLGTHTSLQTCAETERRR